MTNTTGPEPAWPPTWPVTIDTLVAWINDYAQALADGDVDPGALLEQFARARTIARATAGIEEWLLLACREAGITLPDLAERIARHPNPDQRRRYVTGPRDRVERLLRDHDSADGRLAALLRTLDADAEHDQAAAHPDPGPTAG